MIRLSILSLLALLVGVLSALRAEVLELRAKLGETQQAREDDER